MKRPPRTWSTALRAVAAACALAWTGAMSAAPPADDEVRSPTAAGAPAAAGLPSAAALDLVEPQHAADLRAPRASSSQAGARAKSPALPGAAADASDATRERPSRAAGPSVSQQLHWQRTGWASLHTSTPPPTHRS